MDDEKPKGKWVQFNNEDGNDEKQQSSSSNTVTSSSNAAILETSVVELPTNKIVSTPTSPAHRIVVPPENLQNVDLRKSPVSAQQPTSTTPSSSSTLPIARISSVTKTSQGGNPSFSNGDVIVSLLPVNTNMAWISPATFRPELVPEELMVPALTLTVEEYVTAMEQLTSDFRFNTYTICYKRLLAAWLITAFLILLIILFSGVVGIGLFALGISWLIINAAAVFLCMFIKIKINQGLERCLGRVNRTLIKHKIILGLDDRGRISCHKVHLCFIYFDPTDCIKRLDEILQMTDDRSRMQSHLDSRDVEIVITGAQNTRRLPIKERGETLFLRYAQRWAKDYLRRRLDWTTGERSENPSAPRHLVSALCPCQYVEEYLKHKPIGSNANGCGEFTDYFPCCPFELITGTRNPNQARTNNIQQ